jgi:pimeloyl-ACP methyl ester carboxylesterase
MHLEVVTRPGPHADAPGIVFVHGAWHAAWCWHEKFFAAFPAFTLAALSLRGHGASDGSDRLPYWRLHEYVDDVVQVAQDLRASTGSDPVLVGHSMGAFIVLKYLERHAAPSAVLLSSPPPHGAFLAATQFAWGHPGAIAANVWRFLRHPTHGVPPLLPDGLFSSALPMPERMSYIDRLQPESALVYADVFAMDQPNPRQITTPLLFVKGESDPFLSTSHLMTNARLFGAAHQEIAGGHDLMLDVTATQVAAAMQTWILTHIT